MKNGRTVSGMKGRQTKFKRGSRSHCTASLERNKAEQEQRKWKAEGETGKCWNKGE